MNRKLLQEHFDEWLCTLYRDRQESIKKLKVQKAVHTSMVAGKLLQDVVEQQLGIHPDELTVEKTEYGKPFVKNDKNFFFNLSHSGEYVVIAYGGCPVGVDIEKIRKMNQRVAQRCYTDQELELVSNGNCCDENFYRIWTMKEAYLKLTGQGLRVPLESVATDLDQMKVKDTEYRFDGCYVDDYYISVCYQGETEVLYSVIEDWDWNTIGTQF